MGSWIPLIGMLLQIVLWGLIIPRIVSRKTMAILTFRPLPEDPKF